MTFPQDEMVRVLSLRWKNIGAGVNLSYSAILPCMENQTDSFLLVFFTLVTQIMSRRASVF